MFVLVLEAGKSHALHKRVEQLFTRAIRWTELKWKTQVWPGRAEDPHCEFVTGHDSHYAVNMEQEEGRPFVSPEPRHGAFGCRDYLQLEWKTNGEHNSILNIFLFSLPDPKCKYENASVLEL